MSQPPGPPDPYGQPAYPQGYGYPPYGPYGYQQPTNGKTTNGKATAALWTGIGLVVFSCCALGILGFIPIVLGANARSEIRASGGQQDGAGMALAGIILGALAIVLSLALIALIVVGIATHTADFGTGGGTRV